MVRQFEQVDLGIACAKTSEPSLEKVFINIREAAMRPLLLFRNAYLFSAAGIAALKTASELNSARQARVEILQVLEKHGWHSSDVETVVQCSPNGPLRPMGVLP
jgi:hypothetical protein